MFLASIFAGGLGTRISIYAMLALIVGALAFLGVKQVQISSLTKEVAVLTDDKNKLTVDNKILKENNDVLKENMKKLATANFTNYNTAKALIDAQASAKKAIDALAMTTKRDKASLDRLNSKLEEMLKDPKNDGPVAPVLREVIREIQKERAAR